MSVEIKFLAKKINEFDMSAEKHPDIKVYNEGLNQLSIIRRDITFINPQALATIDQYLNDNGRLAYKEYFKNHFDKATVKLKKKGKQ